MTDYTLSNLFPGRVTVLNSAPEADGDYVLYWMQQSQREEENHALEYSIAMSNNTGKPLLVCFGLMADYPEANIRHYTFMLQGLRDVKASLDKRGIPFVVRRGVPSDVALELGRKASVIVCDRGYLRHQRQWREQVARDAGCRVVQVESDLIVPVEIASDKKEYAARTFRPKIQKNVPEYLSPLPGVRSNVKSQIALPGISLEDPDITDVLRVPEDVGSVPLFAGGTHAAKRFLKDFVTASLDHYARNRNQPQTNNVSHMSKYLHFGHISPSYVARFVSNSQNGTSEDRASFLDELIVRRELTYNFVFYTTDYDRYSCVPEWARQTLDAHRHDSRGFHYTRLQLEKGATHDPYWNAAMKEMRKTGYMHNYMRMYWGKKILEWTSTPEYAYKTALYLNNKYFIDGRDPNSFANIGWIFGLHDRPWPERPVYGKVRSMSAKGLERKGHPEQYVEKVERARP